MPDTIFDTIFSARTVAIAIANAQLFEELRQANAHLEVAQAELVQKTRMAAVGQFAAGMAHEIKNPLTAIKTFTEFLPERYHDPVFREKFFRIVSGEVTRINTLVQELSDFAKPAPLRLAPTCVAKVLEDVLTLLSNQCLKQGVRVEAALPDGAPPIHADAQQLKQVFLNLFLNSFEAMPQGGRLMVEAQTRDAQVEVRIQDTGCGIAPEHLEKLFDPFFTTKERGMGLGLAIVKSIVERHGGRITVESHRGQGTTFALEFPAARFVAVA